MKTNQRQKGFSLILVLVVLTILLIASTSLITSSSTVDIVAGNIAFREAAIQIADTGISQAISDLTNLTNFEADVTGQYFATQLATDLNGLPSNLDWSQIPITTNQGYSIQHITERLCTGTLPIANVNSQCSVNQLSTFGSNKIGAVTIMTSGKIYYRVTVRVVGPHNTLSFVQAILIR